MAKQSKGQKETVGRVMHEFKHGELETGTGKPVKSKRQAVAIALHEAGSSREESPAKNERNLRRTKGKERAGETARDEKEGRKPAGSSSRRAGDGTSKAALYAEAKRKGVPGRSTMSKDELERALGR